MNKSTDKCWSTSSISSLKLNLFKGLKTGKPRSGGPSAATKENLKDNLRVGSNDWSDASLVKETILRSIFVSKKSYSPTNMCNFNDLCQLIKNLFPLLQYSRYSPCIKGHCYRSLSFKVNINAIFHVTVEAQSIHSSVLKISPCHKR